MDLAIQVVQHHLVESLPDTQGLPLLFESPQDLIAQRQTSTGRGTLIVLGIDMHGDIRDLFHGFN